MTNIVGVAAAAAAIDAAPAATDWAAFLGRLHPLVLHLPIGLLAGWWLVELLAVGMREAGVRRARTLLLAATAFSAVLATGSGWLLAEEGSHAGGALQWHRWLGIALAAVLVASLAGQWLAGGRRPAAAATLRLGGLLLATALTAATGHLGGTMTHGRGHLVRHAPPTLRGWLERADTLVAGGDAAARGAATEADADADAPVAITRDPATADDLSLTLVALETHCVRCHGEESAKSGLRLDTAGGIGSVLTPGNAPESELFRRVTLAAAHPDFMPPDRGAMDDSQIAALRRWINAGASLESVARREAAARSEAAARTASLEAVATASGSLLVPLPGGDLRVDLARGGGGGTITPARLAALEPVAGRIVELSLAGTAADPGLAAAEALPTLPRAVAVRLERSGLEPAALTAILGRVPAVRRLNAHGSRLDASSLPVLGSLVALEELFIAGTPLEADPGREAVVAALPGVHVVGSLALPTDPLADLPAFPPDTEGDVTP